VWPSLCMKKSLLREKVGKFDKEIVLGISMLLAI
jgi:hypothetical protein